MEMGGAKETLKKKKRQEDYSCIILITGWNMYLWSLFSINGFGDV
jgi:hypothetical protein